MNNANWPFLCDETHVFDEIQTKVRWFYRFPDYVRTGTCKTVLIESLHDVSLDLTVSEVVVLSPRNDFDSVKNAIVFDDRQANGGAHRRVSFYRLYGPTRFDRHR